MSSAKKGVSSPAGIFWSLQPAFCCALIYLFGSNFLALNVIISVRCIYIGSRDELSVVARIQREICIFSHPFGELSYHF